jgi:predicted glycosyltransferase
MYLYENYGIPYVIGNPLASDDFDSIVFNDLRASISSQVVKNSYLSLLDDSASTAFIGESVTMGSEAAASALSGTPARLIRTTECQVDVKPFFHGETEIAEELKKAAVIHGDPLFKNARSHRVRGFDATRQTWIDEPHLAMSGRLYFRD